MAYRETELIERCHECEQPCAAQCARCMGFFCAAHLFTDAGVCEPCESEYLKRPSARSSAARTVFAGVSGAAYVGLGLALGPVGVALGMYASMFVGGPIWLLLTRRAQRVSRRAYLDELRPHRQLAAGGG